MLKDSYGAVGSSVFGDSVVVSEDRCFRWFGLFKTPVEVSFSRQAEVIEVGDRI